MSVKMPFEFCFWVMHRFDDRYFFYDILHDDSCRYSRGNSFEFSGTVAVVSQDIKMQAAVTIGKVHVARRGFLLEIEGFAGVEPPFMVTDALNTSFGGFYELEFSPQDPEITWASHYAPEDGGEIILSLVASETFFGRIHFTGKTSAFVMAFGTNGSPSPRIGDSFWFADVPETLLGKIQGVRPVLASELGDIFTY